VPLTSVRGVGRGLSPPIIWPCRRLPPTATQLLPETATVYTQLIAALLTSHRHKLWACVYVEALLSPFAVRVMRGVAHTQNCTVLTAALLLYAGCAAPPCVYAEVLLRSSAVRGAGACAIADRYLLHCFSTPVALRLRACMLTFYFDHLLCVARGRALSRIDTLC